MKAGFEYTIETLNRDGEVVDVEVVKNLVPTAGLNHFLDVVLKSGSAYGSWYIGLYEGNYTPVAGVTMSTLPADSTETTAYDEAARQVFTPGTISSGAVDNTASKAEFTFNASKTIYGGFITSSSAKSATTGLALSVVRFGTAKVVESGYVLRVSAGLTLSNA